MKYHPQQDGEWIAPRKGYKMACCDCGLIHRLEFRIVNGKVQFRAWRDSLATAARRHHNTSGISKVFGRYLLSKRLAKKFGYDAGTPANIDVKVVKLSKGKFAVR